MNVRAGLTGGEVPWYRAAFRGDYLRLYTHRDEAEALELARQAATTTGLAPGALVADVPCGAGRHLRAFEAAGWRCVGLDLSGDLLRGAKAAAPDCSVAQADIRHIPLPHGRFDLVANVFTSLGYFSDDGDNGRAVAELARLVRPGGWLLIDFLDVATLRQTLRPFSERTNSEGWLISETRRIIPADPGKGQVVDRVRKDIVIQRPVGTEPQQHFEEVALLDEPWFLARFAEMGFSSVLRFYGYDGRTAASQTRVDQGSAAHSDRLILFARKDS